MESPGAGDPGAAFLPTAPYPGAAAVAGMDDEAFRARFAGTPLTRPKAQGMRRNARIALDNAGHARAGRRPSTEVIGAVTVFCGSSDRVDAKYFDAARELGEKLARRRWRLVYGGGGLGLMGALARAVLAPAARWSASSPRRCWISGWGRPR